MSRNQRLALLGGAVVVLIVAFVIASSGGDDDKDKNASSTTTSTQSASESGSPSSQTGQPEKPATTAQVLEVKGGKPVGGVKTLKYNHNDQVAIDVRSDQTVPIHVHGFDIEKTVPGGGVAKFRFKANIEGRFEIAVESPGTPIADLQVAP
jgi:hypothetical protein